MVARLVWRRNSGRIKDNPSKNHWELRQTHHFSTNTFHGHANAHKTQNILHASDATHDLQKIIRQILPADFTTYFILWNYTTILQKDTTINTTCGALLLLLLKLIVMIMKVIAVESGLHARIVMITWIVIIVIMNWIAIPWLSPRERKSKRRKAAAAASKTQEECKKERGSGRELQPAELPSHHD